METKFIPYESVRKLSGTRVLVLAPHPDDEVFGCAGAIMRHVAAGEQVTAHIVTDGAYRAHHSDSEAVVEIRQKESISAASVLGYGAPQFWGLPDRGLHYCEALVLRIQNAIEASHADLVYVPSIFEIHPDHRALAMATLEAVRRAASGVTLAMYEVGVPMVHPNVLLDISDLGARKAQAMACFTSQLKAQAYDQQINALNRFRTYTLEPNVTLAEAYFVIQPNELNGRMHDLFGGLYAGVVDASPEGAIGDTALVSVLIRSMDRPLLREALNSVALQTYVNVEVVVVNARQQTHRELGEKCGRYPLRLLQTNGSLSRSAAANYAMDSARGQYFVFLDDDDWIAPDHINLLVSALQSSPGKLAAYCGTELRDASGQQFGLEPMNSPYSVGRLRSGNYIPLNAILFSRNVVEKGARFDDQLSVYEDWDFLLQISQWSEFIHVDQIAAYYRASGQSGVGLIADDQYKKEARIRIFDKWRRLWSAVQIEELVSALSQMTLEVIAREEARTRTIVESHGLVLAELRQTIDGLRAELVQFQAQKDADALLISQKDHEINIAHAELVSLQSAAVLLEEKIVQLQNEIETLSSDIQKKNSQLYDILHSTSWAVSAPVRTMGRVGIWAKKTGRHGIRRLLGVSRWPRGAPTVSQGFCGETLTAPADSGFAPLISVILPVYNACRVDKKFFWNALKSIYAQTYKNIELIVVDDGSTDASYALYEEFMQAHPGFNAKYVTQTNAGQSSARNYGVQVCQGQYVSFVDQDDEWYADRLEKVVPWLADAEIDLLYTDADNIDAAGQVTYKSLHKTYGFGWPHPKRQIEDILFKDIIVMPGVMIMKKEIYEAVGGFDVNLSGYEDDDLFLRIFEIGKVFYLPVSTLRWRMYGDNYSFSGRMLKSRSYYWKKLLQNYTNDQRDTFRVRMISMRFFQEFLTQSLAQFQAGSELYRHSMEGAREIIPYLPKFPRLVFSIGFALPQKFTLRAMVKISHYFRSS